ncbi:CAP domain-containing protein [Patescibacteria group bacterium]|nr:CAP domain-containing protein [Patescibacteria group bacterium]
MRGFILWFKKYFIPHEGNDHQPHILRKDSIVLMGMIIFAVEALFVLRSLGIISTDQLTALILPNALVDETNAVRISDELLPLKTNALLELAAQDKANDMAKNSYFAHTSPAGLTPWYWFQKVGYNFEYAGENLAVNFLDSKDVINAWMNSPSHRANILNNHFKEIGIATAKGTYDGKPAVFAVQLFGTQSPVASAVVFKQTSQAVQPEVIAESSNGNGNGSSTFVAVKGAEAQNAVMVTIKNSNSVADALVSPRNTVNFIFYIIGIFIILSVALNIFIKFEIQHGYLILNGFFLIIFLGALIALNQYIVFYQVKIL